MPGLLGSSVAAIVIIFREGTATWFVKGRGCDGKRCRLIHRLSWITRLFY